MPDPTLLTELRWLTSHAVALGADRQRVERLADALVDLLLDAQDPRRKRTLALAERVAMARNAGVGISELCERYDKSRSQIYRLLARRRMTSRDTSAVQSSHRHSED